jgi:hypothetical protein
MIVIFKYIIPNKYCGLSIYPFIFLKHLNLKTDKILINHEKIHLKQQIELLWVFFFIWYAVEYFIRLLQCKNHEKAYKKISFEKEAYTNQSNLDYLKTRKIFSFLSYFK